MRAMPRSAKYTTALHPVSDILGLIGVFLPQSGDPWISAYQSDPARFLVVLVVVASLMWLNVRLGASITDKMGALWEKPPVGQSADLLPSDFVYRLRTNPIYQASLQSLKRHIAPFVFAVLFVWLGVTLLAHALFVVEDASGIFCSRSPSAKELSSTERVQVTFAPNNFCLGSGLVLNEGSKYRITVKRIGSDEWRDGDIETTLGGFHIADLPLWRRLPFLVALPLKRDLIRPWFRMILRVGPTGTYEDFLDPDPNNAKRDDTLEETFRPFATGELFVYVNDAALPVPAIKDLFYRNNSGQALITIERL